MTLIDRYVTDTAGGGGTGTFASPWTFAEAVSNYAPGDRINVIEGTYNFGGNVTLSTSASNSHPIIWRGRNNADTDDGRPLLNMGSNIFTINGEWLNFYNFDFTGISTTYVVSANIDECLLYNCKIYNTNKSSTQGALYLADSAIYNSLIYSNSTATNSYCISIDGAVTICGCKIVTESKAIGSLSNVRGIYLLNSLLIGNGTYDSLTITSIENYTMYLFIQNNTFYNFINGIVSNSLVNFNSTTPVIVHNNLFHSCVSDNPSVDGFAIKSLHEETEALYPKDTYIHIFNNAYYNCSAGFHNLGDNPDIRTIECTDDPFANISAGDFSLNNAPNGGALLRGTFGSPAYNW